MFLNVYKNITQQTTAGELRHNASLKKKVSLANAACVARFVPQLSGFLKHCDTQKQNSLQATWNSFLLLKTLICRLCDKSFLKGAHITFYIYYP